MSIATLFTWLSGRVWVLPVAIVALQLAIVLTSRFLIYRRKEEPKRLSELLKQNRGIDSSVSPWYFRWYLIVSQPSWAWIMFWVVNTTNVLLWTLANVVPVTSPSFGVSAVEILFLSVFSLALSCYSSDAFWQLDSKLVYFYKKIENQENRKGLIHKVFLLEALRAVEQTAEFVSTRVKTEGDEHICDVPKREDALRAKEGRVATLAMIQHNINSNFLSLDKDDDCSERIVEDLFLHIARETMKPLAASVESMVKNPENNTIWFPTAYAVPVWKSSLALATERSTEPCATSTVSFKEFYEYYRSATYDHPETSTVSTARRLFLVDSTITQWQEELKIQLLALEEDDKRALTMLPMSKQGNARVTYFGWVKQVHDLVGWAVKFMDLRTAEAIRQRWVGDLPYYMDFLIVPATTHWKVIFACNLSEKKVSNFYKLPLECCPITLKYTTSSNSVDFFESLWSDNAAMSAQEWLESHFATNNAIRKLQAYRSLVESLSV